MVPWTAPRYKRVIGCYINIVGTLWLDVVELDSVARLVEWEERGVGVAAVIDVWDVDEQLETLQG